jgi:hypothetical protein
VPRYPNRCARGARGSYDADALTARVLRLLAGPPVSGNDLARALGHVKLGRALHRFLKRLLAAGAVTFDRRTGYQAAPR